MTIDRSRIAAVFDVPEAVIGTEPEVGMVDQARANISGLREPLLSVGEVAVYLGLSVAATKRIAPTELPFSRISARNDRRYSRADVDRYVESRKVVE